ncbi:MAG: DUF29 domain-containing protein [Xanthobacteraceae bacterium]
MANRTRTDNVDLVPAAEPASRAYERDFYTWSQEQARLVREGRWDAVDRENVAEEIESLGRTEFAKLESALRVLLVHILKWDHQPQRRSKSWIISIKDQRIAFERVLQDNPGLKSRQDEVLVRAYERARLQAAEQTGLDEDRFPETCAYSWDDIAGRSFSL